MTLEAKDVNNVVIFDAGAEVLILTVIASYIQHVSLFQDGALQAFHQSVNVKNGVRHSGLWNIWSPGKGKQALLTAQQFIAWVVQVSEIK